MDDATVAVRKVGFVAVLGAASEVVLGESCWTRLGIVADALLSNGSPLKLTVALEIPPDRNAWMEPVALAERSFGPGVVTVNPELENSGLRTDPFGAATVRFRVLLLKPRAMGYESVTGIVIGTPQV